MPCSNNSINVSSNWNSESMNEREQNGHSFPENQDVLDLIKKSIHVYFHFQIGSANSYTPDSSNADTAPWQATLVESGIHNGGHQQPFFQIVASNNTQNILFDPRIRNNFNSPSLEFMRKMGTNQVLSMYQHNESHHSTQSNSAQVDPDPFVVM